MKGVLTNEMEDYQKAEVDYINGMKYKDIAKKYGKALSTFLGGAYGKKTEKLFMVKESN